MRREPARALTLRSLDVDGLRVPANSVVWVWQRSNGWATVEFRDRRGRVPEAALTSYPVTPPPLEDLRSLDGSSEREVGRAFTFWSSGSAYPV